VDQIRDPPGLVSSQGIHRIDQDRLNSALGLGVLLAAVLQQWKQETLGFAGTGACGHQGVLGAPRKQALKSFFLVPVRRKGQRDLGEPITARALMEWQRDRDVGALEQLLAVRQETINQSTEARRCGMKSRADGVLRHLLQFTGNNGREHR